MIATFSLCVISYRYSYLRTKEVPGENGEKGFFSELACQGLHAHVQRVKTATCLEVYVQMSGVYIYILIRIYVCIHVSMYI